MCWKYLIKVLGAQFKEVRVDSWRELLDELEELEFEHYVVKGVYDSNGHRVPI